MLAEFGLLDGRGRVDAELTGSLAVLCRPANEFYGWLRRGSRP